MKQTLLAVFFSLFTVAMFANGGFDGIEPTPKVVKISIYPNPATDYISVNNDENVKEIVVFNLVGRKLKTFTQIEKDEHYDVSELPNGMYLVQVIDLTNKIITTQRISKR